MQEPYLKCACGKCDAPIEFPAEGLGQSIPCPHCGENTQLVQIEPVLRDPEPSDSKRSKPVLLIVLACAAVAAAMGLGIFAASKSSKSPPPAQEISVAESEVEDGKPKKNRRKKPAAKRAKAAPSAALESDGLKASDVTIQKSDSSRLIYAIGTVHNDTDRQRFGVKVDLDLFDAQDTKLGSARDYAPVIEPRKNWNFKALVTDSKAVRAKVISISEN